MCTRVVHIHNETCAMHGQISGETWMKLHLPRAVILLTLGVTLALTDFGSVLATEVENPTCELIRPGTYRLDYQASPGAGAVEVFASSRPDRIDSDKPALMIRKTPAEVSIPGRTSRIYFHLKPASGATRVVSIRRLPLEGAKNFRDLGGYRTSDGHYVRWGLVSRSNYLANLTANDYEYLNSLGIRLVCDVRADGERMRSPTQWTGSSPEFLSVPIGPNRDGTLTAEDLKRRVAAVNSPGDRPIAGYDFA